MGEHRTRLSSRTKVALAGVGASAAVVAAVIGGGAAAAVDLPGLSGVTSTVVTPDDTQGFAPSDTRPVSSREFTEEFGGAGGSKGALKLVTEDSAGKVDFFKSAGDAPLSTFATKFSYSAYKSSTSTGAANQFPSAQLAIYANGPSSGFSTLTFEPVYQTGDNAAVSTDEWHHYDLTTGLFCSTKVIGGFDADHTKCSNGGLKTLTQIAADNPNATIIGFGVNQGSGNPGIISAVDQFETPTATYDFEKTKPVVVPPVTSTVTSTPTTTTESTKTTDPTKTTEPGKGDGHGGWGDGPGSWGHPGDWGNGGPGKGHGGDGGHPGDWGNGKGGWGKGGWDKGDGHDCGCSQR